MVEPFLVPKIVVEQGTVELRLAADVLDGGAGEAASREEALGCVEDLVSGAGIGGLTHVS